MTDKTIHEKLASIQHRLIATKDSYNNFGKYKYRNVESILAALKPLLTEYGCYVVIKDSIQMIGNRFYIEAIATISDGVGEVSVSALAREADSKKGMDEAQVTGATSSYARKYALGGLFAIDDNPDHDALNLNEDYNKPKEEILSPAEIIQNIKLCMTEDKIIEWYRYAIAHHNHAQDAIVEACTLRKKELTDDAKTD